MQNNFYNFNHIHKNGFQHLFLVYLFFILLHRFYLLILNSFLFHLLKFYGFIIYLLCLNLLEFQENFFNLVGNLEILYVIIYFNQFLVAKFLLSLVFY
mmetsp:Transcript_6697/g.600  ORF Transcript_6697/g.600 Transcript_6697/m.600 type:complete len:98 (-) Transcript_6697:83-376(-)